MSLGGHLLNVSKHWGEINLRLSNEPVEFRWSWLFGLNPAAVLVPCMNMGEKDLADFVYVPAQTDVRCTVKQLSLGIRRSFCRPVLGEKPW